MRACAPGVVPILLLGSDLRERERERERCELIFGGRKCERAENCIYLPELLRC